VKVGTDEFWTQALLSHTVDDFWKKIWIGSTMSAIVFDWGHNLCMMMGWGR